MKHKHIKPSKKRYGYRDEHGGCDFRCAEAVWHCIGRSFYQCTRGPGHGPKKLYCKQHARKYQKGGE